MIDRDRTNEPVLARAALRAFVRAAQSQPIAPTRLTAHEVQRAWVREQDERRRTRKVLALGVGLGLAAAAALALITTSLLGVGDDEDPAGTVAIQVASSDADSASARSTPGSLDPAVRVRSDQAGAPRVLGPWSIALDAGSHQLIVQAVPDHALRIELPERTIELVHGEMSVEVVERSAVVRLESGIAAWVSADGTRTQIEVERIELGHLESVEVGSVESSESVESEPSASALAREAEHELLAGHRSEAISVLRKLVRKHPRTPQARTALLDLAAQERLAGDTNRARCAYQLYLERWPHAEVRAEIDKQIAKLGEGPGCHGLDPR